MDAPPSYTPPFTPLKPCTLPFYTTTTRVLCSGTPEFSISSYVPSTHYTTFLLLSAPHATTISFLSHTLPYLSAFPPSPYPLNKHVFRAAHSGTPHPFSQSLSRPHTHTSLLYLSHHRPFTSLSHTSTPPLPASLYYIKKIDLLPVSYTIISPHPLLLSLKLPHLVSHTHSCPYNNTYAPPCSSQHTIYAPPCSSHHTSSPLMAPYL